MPFFKIKYAPLAAVLIMLAGCGGGENTPAGASANQNNISGIAATGAPLSGVAVSATSLTDSATVSAVTNSTAFFEFKLDPAKAPYLLEATDTSVSPARKYQALVPENDISTSGGSVNITPISTMAAQIVLNEGVAGKSPAEIKTLRLHAAELVKKALQPLLDDMKITETAEQLLTGPLIPKQDALDKMLDTFSLSCKSKICTLTTSSTLAQNKLGTQDLLIDVSSLTTATASPVMTASALGSVAPAAIVLSAEPQTLSAAKSAITNQRVYVGYYPSWSDNWFSSLSTTGAALSNDAIVKTSQMARIPAVYTHVMTAFAQPNFSYTRASNFVGNHWDGTGLDFSAGPKDIKRAIDVLHARGLKVILSVGGASYGNWTALAAESLAAGPITTALKQVMLDVGFDGLDVDYELEGTTAARIAEYKGAVNAMRRAVDLAGGGRVLALAAWSVGADCTAQTGVSAAACGGKVSYWSGGSTGRERLLFSQPGMAQKINMVSIMTYDVRYEHFDGPKAWTLYRDMFPSTTIVNIGLQTSPEGWPGGVLVINNADALCTGSKILKDQFSATVAQAYSVERYAKAPMLQRPTSNPRDGAMLWEMRKTATAACGASVVASPGTIASKLATLYGLQRDDRAAWK